MTVSILLPFHNAAPWIAETLASIQSQSLTDWELIAIDDFSTDDSYSILLEIAANDSRIQLHHNAQKGIIPALQLGLSKASGDYLTRMDADDLMPENRLEWMVNKLLQLPPLSIVTGKVRYFSEQDVSEGYRKYENWLNERVDLNDHYDHIYRECVVASPNWLARRTEIIQYGIFDQLQYPEDYDMAFRWKAEGFSLFGLDTVTLLWREHRLRTSRNSEVYAQESFFSLKLDWFCRMQQPKSLAILGAGQKGKIAAKELLAREIEFTWYDLDWKKYLSPVYGKTVQDYTMLSEKQLLIAIYPKKIKPLLAFIHEKGFEIGKNAWFL